MHIINHAIGKMIKIHINSHSEFIIHNINYISGHFIFQSKQPIIWKDNMKGDRSFTQGKNTSTLKTPKRETAHHLLPSK